MLGGVSRSERGDREAKMHMSMLAPCNLFAGRGDSLGPIILYCHKDGWGS